MMQNMVALFGTIGICALAVTPVNAAPQADAVMTNLVQHAPTPQSFTAATTMDLKQRSFPWTKVSLKGTSYFKAPNQLVVKFSNMPGYMSGLPQAYAKVLNVGAWPREYNATLGDSQNFNGHTDYALDLTPKEGGSDRGVALVNPTNWTVERVTWDLSGGVQLAVSENYADVGSYRVPAKQNLSVRTPYATADGTATLDGYAMNVPINDGIFTKQ
jgi:outer membrane lipoprotein-sorting protein